MCDNTARTVLRGGTGREPRSYSTNLPICISATKAFTIKAWGLAEFSKLGRFQINEGCVVK